jgi:hypothetical protein
VRGVIEALVGLLIAAMLLALAAAAGRETRLGVLPGMHEHEAATVLAANRPPVALAGRPVEGEDIWKQTVWVPRAWTHDAGFEVTYVAGSVRSVRRFH